MGLGSSQPEKPQMQAQTTSSQSYTSSYSYQAPSTTSSQQSIYNTPKPYVPPQTQNSQTYSYQQKSTVVSAPISQTGIKSQGYSTYQAQTSQPYSNQYNSAVQSQTSTSQPKTIQTSYQSGSYSQQTSQYNQSNSKNSQAPERKNNKKKKNPDFGKYCREHDKDAYLGKKRCYGYYRCVGCNRYWESANSWVQSDQRCQKCQQWTTAYCYHSLQKPGEEKQQDEKKPHQQKNCAMCIKLRRPCYGTGDSEYGYGESHAGGDDDNYGYGDDDDNYGYGDDDGCGENYDEYDYAYSNNKNHSGYNNNKKNYGYEKKKKNYNYDSYDYGYD